ncbi:MAG: GHKL domain-containing protein [Planctomycetota bacterium]|nr:MAG: GHKL domain-containing protein [Planctomycetota bacterium]
MQEAPAAAAEVASGSNASGELSGASSEIERRAAALLAANRYRLHCSIDRMFAGLMLIQWVLGIGLALFVSPLTWIGNVSAIHTHVWAAVVLGAVLSSLPIYLALIHPGTALTRHTIAIAQALWSALLIHLSGGRIETHFHVFGSLAFLAFYRDWRVLITASLVVAVDHFVRGVWWPQSVFGVILSSPFRWIEHSVWVVFEDVFLIASCVAGVQEMADGARRQAELEVTNATIELQIRQRTAALQRATEALEVANQRLQLEAQKLAASNTSLEEEIRQREQAEKERAAMQQQLLAASRAAGIAEMATGVLHNVGNVLNSINVSAQLLMEHVHSASARNLRKVADLLQEQADDLPRFFANDPRGPKLVEFLDKLSDRLEYENQDLASELSALVDNVNHANEIVRKQQAYARSGGIREVVELPRLVEDAIKTLGADFAEQGIELVRQLEPVPPLETDKHKVLQILTNLLTNARHAVLAVDRIDRSIELYVGCRGTEQVVIQVRDNGVGIPADQLTKVFQYGFTTKKNGHGFGLHSCALAAKELGGSLDVSSPGAGCGATFTLTLPLTSSPARVVSGEATRLSDSASANDTGWEARTAAAVSSPPAV